MVEVGKTYRIYAPNNGRQLDDVEVTKVVGRAFYCYSLLTDVDTSYDLHDGIEVKELSYADGYNEGYAEAKAKFEDSIHIPKKATNGEVYEITFKPYNRVICRDGLKKGSVLVYMTMEDNCKGILAAKEYDLEWWNAPFGRKEK